MTTRSNKTRRTKQAKLPQSGKRSSSPPKAGAPTELEWIARPDVPTLWFDNVRFSLRVDRATGARNFAFGFYQMIEGDKQRFEASRVITSEAQAKSMIEAMCRLLDYYPAKPEGSKA